MTDSEERAWDKVSDLEDKIKRLEKENAELKADNDARKFAMAMSAKVEKQLREENAELKEAIKHFNPCGEWDDVTQHWEKANNPSYRPFMDSAELILEWNKKVSGDLITTLREPLIWVKHKVDDRRRLITGFGENFVELGNKAKPVTMQRLFEMYEFLDGTPCGVKE